MIDLRLGDCLEIMKDIPSGSVDAVVTDPPYGTKTNQRDGWMIGEYSNIMPLVLPILHDKLADDGAFYCFTSWTMMAEWLLRYQQYFRLQNILIWDKGRHSGCWSKSAWQFTWEGVFYGIKGPARIRKYMRDVLHSEEVGKRLPMQKPIDIICQMIEASTDEDSTVLDPFMGSGTTGVACVQTGRSFIGIEIDPGYFAIAKRRIEEAQLQVRMAI
jgi:site-specific DNA-methyltransferase (adenine-specific)